MSNGQSPPPSFVQPADWDSFLTRHPNVHLLQTTAWGTLKAAFGWRVARVMVEDTGAQILVRQMLPGMHFAYIARGPVGEDWEALWPAVDDFCRRNRVVFLKVEPDQWIGADGSNHPPTGFRASPHAIQPPRTLLVDLNGDEETLLGRMKQKTRYNIKLAQKKNVIVRPTSDIALFHHLMQVTGGRDQFGVHSLAYYQQVYQLFHPHDS
jgi:peptidoglycan pentaglycine glycine transferase (the first glycine)